MLIQSGNEIPIELIQTVLKMAPTTDGELKLWLFTDKLTQLGPVERLVMALVDMSLAFKRLNLGTYHSCLHLRVIHIWS